MTTKKALKDLAIFFGLSLRLFMVVVVVFLSANASGLLAFLGYAVVGLLILSAPPRIVEALKL